MGWGGGGGRMPNLYSYILGLLLGDILEEYFTLLKVCVTQNGVGIEVLVDRMGRGKGAKHVHRYCGSARITDTTDFPLT